MYIFQWDQERSRDSVASNYIGLWVFCIACDGFNNAACQNLNTKFFFL